MTTPEQFAKWHREAKFAYGCDNTITVSGDPYSTYITGYLRAKQENEQVMKLAKFAVKVLQVDWTDEGGISEWELERGAKASGLCNSDGALLPNIEATIKGLLND